MTSIGADLDEATMNALTPFLKDNVDVFAWKLADMPHIDPNLFYHNLSPHHAATPAPNWSDNN